VYATHFGGCSHTDFECIATFDDNPDFGAVSFEGEGTIMIPDTFDGTNSDGQSMSSFSFLEWRLEYQDGTETGTTEFITTSFVPFPLTFIDEKESFRTLIVAEVRGITSFDGIGKDFCHDLPRTNFSQELLVNGQSVPLLKQLFGSNEFNEGTSINTGFGIKFLPQFIERQLADSGVELNTGDIITWKISLNNRYTLYLGGINSNAGDIDCTATRGVAWDAYATGMSFQHKFVWADPFELITIPTTTEPDLDGDGIPDVDDLCDFSGERFNGFQDEDGCPDDDPIGFDPTTITDQDGDGILDVDDLCPNEAETFNTVEDGDGCPDGASLDIGFRSFDASGQLVVDLTKEPAPAPLPPLIQMPEIQTQPISVENIDLIEDIPESMFSVSEQLSDQPTLTTGTSEICDRSVENCNQVIQQAVQQAVQEALIPVLMVPFELSLLNLVFLIGAVVGVIAIVMFVRRRRK
jgi:hypothetical protein